MQDHKCQPWRRVASGWESDKYYIKKVISLGSDSMKSKKNKRGQLRILKKRKKTKTCKFLPVFCPLTKSLLKEPASMRTELTEKVAVKLGTLSLKWKELIKKHTICIQSYICKKSDDMDKTLFLMKSLPPKWAMNLRKL